MGRGGEGRHVQRLSRFPRAVSEAPRREFPDGKLSAHAEEHLREAPAFEAARKGEDAVRILAEEITRIEEARKCRQEAAEYEMALAANTPAMWRAFLKSWPEGRYRLDVEIRLRS